MYQIKKGFSCWGTKSSWGTGSPRPLRGLCPWIPLGDFPQPRCANPNYATDGDKSDYSGTDDTGGKDYNGNDNATTYGVKSTIMKTKNDTHNDH